MDYGPYRAYGAYRPLPKFPNLPRLEEPAQCAEGGAVEDARGGSGVEAAEGVAVGGLKEKSA